MHYSPRIWPENDPELRLIFLSLPRQPPGHLRRPAGRRLALDSSDSLRPSRIGGRQLAAVFNNNNPDLLLLISPTAGAVLLRESERRS